MSASASQASAAQGPAGQQVRVKVWDLPLRLFHWLLVVAVALAFLSSEEDSPLNQWHVLAGWVVGILLVFRLVWGFVGGEHSRFANFIRLSRIGEHISGLLRGRSESTLGHNPLGAVAVVILLALAAATVWTGAFGGKATEDLHGFIGWTLLLFVGFHIAAVVIMSLLQRENLVGAMITGTKPAARHVGAVNAQRPSLAGIIVAILALAAAVYGVLKYDPSAFTLRPSEAFEQHASRAGDASPHRPEREDKD